MFARSLRTHCVQSHANLQQSVHLKTREVDAIGPLARRQWPRVTTFSCASRNKGGRRIARRRALPLPIRFDVRESVFAGVGRINH